MKLETIGNIKCELAEGPIWDAVKKSICWIDILKGEIHEYLFDHSAHKIISLHQMIGSIAICTNGNFIAAVQNGFAFVDRLSGEIQMISDPELHLPHNRFNEKM